MSVVTFALGHSLLCAGVTRYLAQEPKSNCYLLVVFVNKDINTDSMHLNHGHGSHVEKLRGVASTF